MAENDRFLDPVVQINGDSYKVQANNVANSLNITVQQGNNAATSIASFNGSEPVTAPIVIPTYTLTKTGSTVTLTGSDGTTSTITDSNTGDMTKSVYDTNNNGKVDIAENAEKLGGTAADNYAKKSDLFSKNYNDLTNRPTIPTDTNQTVKADGKTFGANAIVEFVAGSNVIISSDSNNNKITISSTGGGSTGGTSDIASKIKVTMNNGFADAEVSIKSTDPTGGNIGDIWFKY